VPPINNRERGKRVTAPSSTSVFAKREKRRVSLKEKEGRIILLRRRGKKISSLFRERGKGEGSEYGKKKRLTYIGKEKEGRVLEREKKGEGKPSKGEGLLLPDLKKKKRKRKPHSTVPSLGRGGEKRLVRKEKSSTSTTRLNL